jgi:hypothetical protein
MCNKEAIAFLRGKGTCAPWDTVSREIFGDFAGSKRMSTIEGDATNIACRRKRKMRWVGPCSEYPRNPLTIIVTNKSSTGSLSNETAANASTPAFDVP